MQFYRRFPFLPLAAAQLFPFCRTCDPVLSESPNTADLNSTYVPTTDECARKGSNDEHDIYPERFSSGWKSLKGD